MSPNSYQPGRRQPPPKQGKGQYAENRYAWARTEQGQAVILYDPEPERQNEPGPDIALLFSRGSSRPFSWVLTGLTEEELNALEDLVSTAISWARPICQLRDKEANDAWKTGDDTRRRSYRPIPQLVYRKRPEPEYSQGVRDRPSDVSSGSGGTDSSEEAVRGSDEVLLESTSDDGKPEDNGPKTD